MTSTVLKFIGETDDNLDGQTEELGASLAMTGSDTGPASVIGETNTKTVIYKCPLCQFTSGSREYLVSRHIKVRQSVKCHPDGRGSWLCIYASSKMPDF